MTAGGHGSDPGPRSRHNWASGPGALAPIRTATVFTHRRPSETAPALARLLSVAREREVTLRFGPLETEKHGLAPADGTVIDAPFDPHVGLCFALGGDGTILSALRRYAGTGVPVFGVNFGEIGFLSAIDRDGAEAGIDRALSGDFDVLALPGIAVGGGAHWSVEERIAINDVSIQRRQGRRVADLAYFIAGEEIGRVRCDGLVVATPAGSTGYNLANGGPVLAWGVEGYVVSFIAPHTLTARALVVAPDDPLTIVNRSREESVDVILDGRPMAVLEPGGELDVRFTAAQGMLAQIPGVTFYARLREKFGRLATLR
ncbi:NAD(+)/NADH kinase [Conexibacter sp. DBS9H8]|uniref:NAD(+)/NADH kinase n=1 Tax=Conexibacter sp. DBS9H8 TaxID=2937801 RepID=UPI00200E521D|nr:NAD(+)/NADH kinase [Conexibacter sp. DBS9H8]